MANSMVDSRLGNLPVDMTSFVGRRHELTEAKALLSTARLLTLTGMGGVGKTRLALRIATNLRRAFRDGVWLVELAGLQDARLLGQTVSATLGLKDRTAGWTVGTLSSFLEARQTLLVLDNCEHLVDACAILADSLLRACPGLRILATSRQPLGIAGEQTLAVLPLSVPEPNLAHQVEGLAQYGAVTLFVDRAAAVHPGFRVDSHNQLAVAGICRRLDGIPLAIELAAGRLRSLSADELLERLDDRYSLLTGGNRAALPRQQTLRALIDWSFDLCLPAEQLLWARLSVFSDGFDLDSVQEVCSDDALATGRVLDVLTGLVEKSVVLPDERDGRVRYLMSETLREYGRDRLQDAGETSELQRRHRDRFLGLVDHAEAGWFGPGQVELLGRLRLEHANLRNALGFSLTEDGDGQAGLAMASALRFYWVMSGRLNEGRHWLDQLLAAHTELSVQRLKALYVDAYLATVLGDHSAADVRLDEAYPRAQQLGEESSIAYVTQIRGLSALFQGDPLRAVVLFEQALAEHRDLGDEAGLAYDQLELALSAALLGQDERAVGLFEECMALSESRGEHWIHALALWALGIEACRQGDLPRATTAEQQSIRLRLPLDDRRSIGLNLDVLAWTAAAGGEYERAARLLGAARAIQDALGTPPTPLRHLADLQAQCQSSTRQALGDAAFLLAMSQGERLAYDEAVAYALGDTVKQASPALDDDRRRSKSSPLTRREHEVAELVAQGLSNREIANALVISPRTAEAHVEHILTKLGFTSRSQVAAWLGDQRGQPSRN